MPELDLLLRGSTVLDPGRSVSADYIAPVLRHGWPRLRLLPWHSWWEFQANQAMGALLMPQMLVEKALVALVAVRGVFGVSSLRCGVTAADTPYLNYEPFMLLIAVARA